MQEDRPLPDDSPLLTVKGPDIPGLPGTPSFELRGPAVPALPVLIAAPHGGRCYAPGLLARLRHPERALMRLEDRHADTLAEAVGKATGVAVLVARAPRAMVDLNRAPDDVDWDMIEQERVHSASSSAPGRRARTGLGLIPRRLPGLGELWRGRHARTDLHARIASVHEPYHQALGDALQGLRDRWGAALLIDVHSMPPLPHRPGHPAPEFVLGDRFGASCDARLSAAAFAHLAAERRLAAHNRPYAGNYVLSRHGAPGSGLHALQLEIDRTSYLDAALMETAEGLEGLVELLCGLVARLGAEAAALGRRELLTDWPEAAE